jgi:hypothetical protein
MTIFSLKCFSKEGANVLPCVRASMPKQSAICHKNIQPSTGSAVSSNTRRSRTIKLWLRYMVCKLFLICISLVLHLKLLLIVVVCVHLAFRGTHRSPLETVLLHTR